MQPTFNLGIEHPYLMQEIVALTPGKSINNLGSSSDYYGVELDMIA